MMYENDDNSELFAALEALKEENKKILKFVDKVMSAYDNQQLALQMIEAHNRAEHETWKNARELAPMHLTDGQASAFGKRLTDAYMFVTNGQEPPKPIGKKAAVYPPCMKKLWNTFYSS